MQITDEKFNQVKEGAEEYYKSIGKVRCPYLEQKVHFNTEGFEHLLFKSWNRARTRIEQYTRLRLISLAVKIIKKSHTLQEYDERKMFVRQKINSRWEKRMRLVRYYVFIAIIDEVRLKVVVKHIEGGEPFFYSMYPSWKVVKQEDGNNKKVKKVFYNGNLENI